MKSLDFSKISVHNCLELIKTWGILFIGAFLLVYSILRINHWGTREIIFVGGVGLSLTLLGIRYRLKFDPLNIGLVGCLISIIAAIFYFFVIQYASDILAAIYTIGIAFLLVDIFSIDLLGDIKRQMADQNLEVVKQIQSIVIQDSTGSNVPSTDLIEVALNVWRLEKRINQISVDIPENQKKSFDFVIQKFKRIMEKNHIEWVDYTDRSYNEGMNLEVLSFEKDPNISTPFVKETIEPAILKDGQVIKKAKVIVVNN